MDTENNQVDEYDEQYPEEITITQLELWFLSGKQSLKANLITALMIVG